MLDNEYVGPYRETGIDYTLTSEDYKSATGNALKVAQTEQDTAWANTIDLYRSFNNLYTANVYIPEILTSNFPALKDSSTINVTYNQYSGQLYGEIASFMLIDDDYIAIGGTIADTLCFTENDDPNDYLPDYLLSNYADANINEYAEVFFRYPDYNTISGGFYIFDGVVWTSVENSIVLTADDYNSMGEDSGQPGKHDNFADDILPANYLSQFLNLKYLYSQADDEVIVVCDFHDDIGTNTIAISCTFNGSSWNIAFPGLQKTAQFIYLEGKWVFDPTVRHSMTSSDFWIIVNYIKDDPTLNVYLDQTYFNTEYYYGASAHYVNFDMRVLKRKSNDPLNLLDGMTDEEILAEMYKRLEEALVLYAETSFPEAEPIVEGIQVYYYITYDIFNDDYEHEFITSKLKCIGTGQFEYIPEE